MSCAGCALLTRDAGGTPQGVGVPLRLLHEGALTVPFRAFASSHALTPPPAQAKVTWSRRVPLSLPPLEAAQLAVHASRLTAVQIQVELKTGETYRGTLVEAEDNWNSQMKDITVTGRVRPATRVTA